MRALLAQLAPALGRVDDNLDRIDAAVREGGVDVAVFPELFLSGYRAGDRMHGLALREGDAAWTRLQKIAKSRDVHLIVGAPVASSERPGEIENVALLVRTDGSVGRQAKRYLPTFGMFDEGTLYTPTDRSEALALDGRKVGLEICYDTFFPEISREVALQGAVLLVSISASPVTSRRLFDTLLPARAVENGFPVVYVNRVGVEDGVVFGGGSGAWDPRGEPIPGKARNLAGAESEERLWEVELDWDEVPRWRPFRPVLRDLATRPGAASTAAPEARTPRPSEPVPRARASHAAPEIELPGSPAFDFHRERGAL